MTATAKKKRRHGRAPPAIPPEMRPPGRCPACGRTWPCPNHPGIPADPWQALRAKLASRRRRALQRAGKVTPAASVAAKTRKPAKPVKRPGRKLGKARAA